MNRKGNHQLAKVNNRGAISVNSDGQKDGGRERFRNRWPRRNDRNGDQPRDQDSQPRQERSVEAEDANGNWNETPSFLTRPVPTVSADDIAEAAPVSDEAPQERRPRREARPRRPREVATDASETSVIPQED